MTTPEPAAEDGQYAQRAIRAACELAAEGGYDAVRMRAVAARAPLSLATLYRYFSSKDHLVAAVQLEWSRTIPDVVPVLREQEGTAADRLARMLQLICGTLGRTPLLGKAVVAALGSDDPQVRAIRQEADGIALRAFADLVGDEVPDPSGALMSLSLALQGALFSWAHGQLELDEVDRLMQDTARTLLAGAAARA